MSERNGNWFLTFSGTRYYPTDPRAEDVSIDDIAHHLSMICRFGGATREHYSVAQHCLLVESIFPGLQSLLHDAPEAYIADIVRPLKYAMPEYLEIEKRNWSVVCERFHLPVEMNPEVKRADNIALMTERRDLLVPSDHKWSISELPMPERIIPMPPRAAEFAFLARYEELMHRHPIMLAV